MDEVAFWVMGGLLAVISTLAGVIYSVWQKRYDEHETALVKIAEIYATKEEVKILAESLKEGMRDIKDAVKEGNLAQKQLLVSLLKIDRATNNGIYEDNHDR